MRGFIIGLTWGGLIGFAVMAVLSLWAPAPDTATTPPPAAPSPTAPTAEAAPQPPQMAATPQMHPQQTAPAPQAPEDPAGEVPLGAPDLAQAEQAPAPADPEPTPPPEESPVESPVESAVETPAQSAVATADPQVTLDLPPASEFNRPPQDLPPDLAQALPTAETPRAQAPQAAPVAVPEAPQPDTESATQPEVVTTPVVTMPAPADPGAPTPEPEPAPEPELEPELEPEPAPEPEPELAPAPDPAGAPDAAAPSPTPAVSSPPDAAAPRSTPLPQVGTPIPGDTDTAAAPAPQPRLPGTRVTPLTGGQSGLIGTDAPGTTTRRPQVGAPAQATTAGRPPALEAHAIPFAGFDGRPVLSVILLDTPEGGADFEALLGLDFPVAIAINPDRADAKIASDAYRAAGFEVVLSASGLPPEGGPQDIAVALEGAFAALPEAVAVIDSPAGLFQRADAARVGAFEAMVREGHGLVTYANGLNRAQAAARQLALPALSVYRVLDAQNENAITIGRYLGRAGIHAGQTGQAIVLGRTLPETITALYDWQASNKARAVQIAPLSAVLRQFGLGDG